jgi:hypothetical protein
VTPTTILRASSIAVLVVGTVVAAGCGSSDTATDAGTRAAQASTTNNRLIPKTCPTETQFKLWTLSIMVSSTLAAPVDVQNPADSISCFQWSGLDNPSRYQFVIRQGNTRREMTTVMKVRTRQPVVGWRTDLVYADGSIAAQMAFRVQCATNKPASKSCTLSVRKASDERDAYRAGEPVVVSPDGAPTVTVTTDGNAGPSSSDRTVGYTIAGG